MQPVEERIDAAVIGGYAMQYYGSDRLTTDVDFVASEKLKGVRAHGTLTFGGVKLIAPNSVPVDWVVRDDDFAKLYAVSLARSSKLKGFRIITPDYLAAMKLASGRAKDLEDLVFLLKEGVVDVKKAGKIVYEFVGGQFARQEFERIVDEAEWRKKRDE